MMPGGSVADLADAALIAQAPALDERVAELETALGRAQEVIHSEWCSGTYHAEPCRDVTAVLVKNRKQA